MKTLCNKAKICSLVFGTLMVLFLLGMGGVDYLARMVIFHPWRYTHDLSKPAFEEQEPGDCDAIHPQLFGQNVSETVDESPPLDKLAGKLLFLPSKFTHNLSSPTFEEVQFQNSKRQAIHGVYFPYKKINTLDFPVGTILYCHGNGENVSILLNLAEEMRSDFRCNVLIFDYAGYGKSEGMPTAPGVLDDGLAALTYLNQKEGIPINQIILYGFSLGGSVAIDLASKHNAKALIVESSFTSLGDMGRKLLPFIPAEYLLREQLASIKKIGKVRCPVFISHGRADQTIPFSQGERLFEVANDPKTFYIPPEGLDYHSAPHCEKHREALRQFFDSL